MFNKKYTDFLDLIKETRSCRRFKENEPLDMKDLEWLTECARLSSCARNAQDLRFLLVSSQSVCNELVNISNWASAIKDWKGPKQGERPTGFIVITAPEKSGEILLYDAGIASQTIQLGAVSRNWASCIILSFDHRKIVNILEIPSVYKPLLIIALGYPAEKRVLENMKENESFNYWRDEAGVHHVPKRALEDLIIKRY